ncbi:MAG: molybdopterin-dependent oxidoreductase [Solirubrobacterales bacterium]
MPLAAARHQSALVAIAQDGEALRREHGFPCRWSTTPISATGPSRAGHPRRWCGPSRG